MNLVSYSEVRIADDDDEGGRPFSSLLPALGCPHFNLEGMLIHAYDGDARVVCIDCILPRTRTSNVRRQ